MCYVLDLTKRAFHFIECLVDQAALTAAFRPHLDRHRQPKQTDLRRKFAAVGQIHRQERTAEQRRFQISAPIRAQPIAPLEFVQNRDQHALDLAAQEHLAHGMQRIIVFDVPDLPFSLER